MRYPASEKAEISRLVEQSPMPVKRTLEKLGIPRATFYRWCDLYHTGGPEALGDRSPRPDRVWIPDMVRDQIIKLALDEPTLSPRELAVRRPIGFVPSPLAECRQGRAKSRLGIWHTGRTCRGDPRAPPEPVAGPTE